MIAPAVPMTVIGGYLGAGKTTLLNHLLQHNAGQRIALLINDFGAVNIDAQLIRESDEAAQRINLTNGCICCGMGDGFDAALDALLIATPRPDHIVVEASGVADVAAVAEYGHRPPLNLDGVIVVADAETVRAKASDKYVAQTVRRQLEAADVVVLNKTDLLDAGALAAISGWLETLVPAARIVPARRCDVPIAVLLGVHAETTTTGRCAEIAHHPHYASFLVESGQPCNRDDIERFIDALPDWVLRAKGFVQLVDGQSLVLQQVGRRATLDAAPASISTGTQIVLIGLRNQIDAASIANAARNLPGARVDPTARAVADPVQEGGQNDFRIGKLF